MSFLWDNAHSTIATTHHTCTCAVKASCSSHLISLVIFNFFHFLEAKYVLGKIVSLHLSRESGLEVGISHEQVKALFELLLSHVFTFLSQEADKFL